MGCIEVREVHYYRACSVHLDEVHEIPDEEVMMCPHGHRVETWVTMCSDGRVIGQSWKNKTGMLVGKRVKEKKSE
jgi:hypothetical protein